MRHNETESDSKLTPIQQKAVELVADGHSVTAAAKEVKKARQTVSLWMGIAEFVAAINRRRAELRGGVADRRIRVGLKALDVIEDALDEDADVNVALQYLRLGPLELADRASGSTNPTTIESDQAIRGLAG